MTTQTTIEIDLDIVAERDLNGEALYPVTITFTDGRRLIGSMCEADYDATDADEIVRMAKADGDTWMWM